MAEVQDKDLPGPLFLESDMRPGRTWPPSRSIDHPDHAPAASHHVHARPLLGVHHVAAYENGVRSTRKWAIPACS
jgi:hypothetical protein